MNDLLKEAIADAKAVRKTALANAKLALEEAFTPKLQSMLSAKIREEAEYDDEVTEMEDEMEEGGISLGPSMDWEEGGVLPDEPVTELEDEEMAMEDEMMDEPVDEVGDINVPDASVNVSGNTLSAGEEDMMDDEMEENLDQDVPAEEADVAVNPTVEEDDLELESIIKELEDEIEEDEMEEPEISESNDHSSEIGTSDNKQPATAASDDNTDDPEGTGVDTLAESEDGMEGESETLDTLTEEDEEETVTEEEEIDLEEVIRSLREEEEELEESEDGMEGESETINNLTEKLKESYSVVKFLRSKINEVNLLNAKLLFTNKLFRNGNLTEGQKLKVIETFDRAKSTREVKLVYTTLAESTIAPRKTKKAVREGFASKRVASTRPSKAVINEGADLAQRFKKLAGLIK